MRKLNGKLVKLGLIILGVLTIGYWYYRFNLESVLSKTALVERVESLSNQITAQLGNEVSEMDVTLSQLVSSQVFEVNYIKSALSSRSKISTQNELSRQKDTSKLFDIGIIDLQKHQHFGRFASEYKKILNNSSKLNKKGSKLFKRNGELELIVWRPLGANYAMVYSSKRLKSVLRDALNLTSIVNSPKGNAYSDIPVEFSFNGSFQKVYLPEKEISVVAKGVWSSTKSLFLVLFFYLIIGIPVYLGVIRSEREKERILSRNQEIEDVQHDLKNIIAYDTLSTVVGRTSGTRKRSIETIIQRAIRLLNDSNTRSKNLEMVNVPLLVNSVIEFKKEEWKNTGVDVKTDFDTSISVYMEAQVTELERCIENVINNSFQELKITGGRIVVSLTEKKGRATIHFKDDGPGFSRKACKQFNKRGKLPSSKTSGSGKGLASVYRNMKRWGGNCRIVEASEKGAEVLLNFNTVDLPSWKTVKIELNAVNRIVILDDDLEVHKLWKSRFKKYNVELISYRTTEVFLKKEKAKDDSTLYLIDQTLNFSRSSGSGIELIKRLGLEDQSILCTSHYSNPDVQRTCEQLGIRLLEKPMISSVPIVRRKA